METLIFKRRKNRKAILKIANNIAKNKKGVARISYYATIVLRIISIVVTIGVLAYAIQSGFYYNLLLLVWGFIPFLLSFMPQTLYLNICNSEYSVRGGQAIDLDETGFTYSYFDNRLIFGQVVISYRVDYDKITSFIYDKDTEELVFEGDFKLMINENGDKEEPVNTGELKFLNVFNKDISKLIVK